MRFVRSWKKISANYHKFFEPTQHSTLTNKRRHPALWTGKIFKKKDYKGLLNANFANIQRESWGGSNEKVTSFANFVARHQQQQTSFLPLQKTFQLILPWGWSGDYNTFFAAHFVFSIFQNTEYRNKFYYFFHKGGLETTPNAQKPEWQVGIPPGNFLRIQKVFVCHPWNRAGKFSDVV